MGPGFIPQSAWLCLEKDENLVEGIQTNKVAYANPLKVTWSACNWTLKSNKCNRAKEMDAISKYHDSEIINGWYISIFYFVFHIFLHLNITI
jgi:SUMO ligase MMS21 Smc5/6 complex component